MNDIIQKNHYEQIEHVFFVDISTTKTAIVGEINDKKIISNNNKNTMSVLPCLYYIIICVEPYFFI